MSCPQAVHELRWRRLTTIVCYLLVDISGAYGISVADH